MLPTGLFGLSAASYTLVNTIGVFMAALAAITLMVIEWLRRKRLAKALPVQSLRRRPNLPFFILSYVVAYGLLVPGTYLTGRLFNVTVLLGQPAVFNSGVNFASGVLIFIGIFLLMARIFPGNGKPTEQLEVVLPALALNHVFNRLACLLGGCCFGVPTTHVGFIYPESAPASEIYGEGTHTFPNLVIESSVMLVCFVVLLILHFRGKRTLPIFPLVFGGTGFLLGFVMNHSYEPLKPLFNFTYPTAFTHLLVFLVGVLFLLLELHRKKRERMAE
ncbi:MAG: prolipoprotein diacylglyceryl transferase [Oscillospiraceae bacterium]|jgi:prolipoprotein diacylglyceryltransferase|nr:prolipoprotein diacylglyceryl transferase [Oscillospiraceae bacterium]